MDALVAMLLGTGLLIVVTLSVLVWLANTVVSLINAYNQRG